MLIFSQERESAYVGDLEEASWVEDVPQQTENWVSGYDFPVDFRCVEKCSSCSK